MNRAHFAILIVLATGLTVAAAFINVSDADAEPFCTNTSCIGALPQTVGPLTASSTADCHWARMAAISQLNAQTNCPFGFCDQTYTTLDDCSDTDPSPWTVTMKLDYSCKKCRGPFQQG